MKKGVAFRKYFMVFGLVFVILGAVGCYYVLTHLNTLRNEQSNILKDEEFHETETSKIFDYEQLYSLNNEMIKTQSKYLDGKDYLPQENIVPCLVEIAEYLNINKDSMSIDYFELDLENENIYIEFKSGLTHIFIPRQDNFLSSGIENTVVTIAPNQDDWRTSIAEWTANINKKQTEYQGDYTITGNAEMISRSVKDYRYSSAVENENVTVDFAKTLSGNKIIIWQGHGAYNKKIGACLITAEQVPMALFFMDDVLEKHKHFKDIDKKRLVTTGGGLTDIVCFALTPEFFNYYYNDDDFKDSLIYLGACYSGKDDKLVKSINKTSRGATVSFSDKVNPSYEVLIRTTFFII